MNVGDIVTVNGRRERVVLVIPATYSEHTVRANGTEVTYWLPTGPQAFFSEPVRRGEG
jgi:hypothetical protein